jgi:hypothetical protein
MPILMTRSTFAALADVREQLVSKTFAASTDDQASPGDIFVPWAGVKLLEGPGIYMVGIAVDAEASEGRHSFESCLQATEAFCVNRRNEREHSPFWRFLDGLTRELLGGPYSETTDRWGWSNLLKICWSEGPPDHWPRELLELQREAYIAAMREELVRLQQSLVFVGALDDFGILKSTVGEESLWNKEHQEEAGLWWLSEAATGNLYVHGYHPSHARRQRFFEAALKRTVELARTHLSPFI